MATRIHRTRSPSCCSGLVLLLAKAAPGLRGARGDVDEHALESVPLVTVSLAPGSGCWQAEDEADYQRQYPDHFEAFADLASPDDAGDVLSAPDPAAQPAALGPGAAEPDSGAARALVEGALLDDIVALHAR